MPYRHPIGGFNLYPNHCGWAIMDDYGNLVELNDAGYTYVLTSWEEAYDELKST